MAGASLEFLLINIFPLLEVLVEVDVGTLEGDVPAIATAAAAAAAAAVFPFT